jgi:hypothetical protein
MVRNVPFVENNTAPFIGFVTLLNVEPAGYVSLFITAPKLMIFVLITTLHQASGQRSSNFFLFVKFFVDSFVLIFKSTSHIQITYFSIEFIQHLKFNIIHFNPLISTIDGL